MKLPVLVSTLLLMLLGISSYGQKTDTSFYDGNWKAADKAKHVYYRITAVTDNDHFLVKDYYKDGSYI